MSDSSNHPLTPRRPGIGDQAHPQRAERDAPLSITTPSGSAQLSDPDSIATMFASGRCWGDFELFEKLGQGGNGVVFRARQISLGREVALKVLTAVGDEVQRTRFRAEAKALARIDSPNVVKVHLIGEHLGFPFFVMEYLRGRDLGALVESGWRPSQAEAVTIIIQVARGLAIAAVHGLCHRDIKPANVMRTQDNEIKLMDFGLVGYIGDHETTISTSGAAGSISGTAHYLSPEQGSGLKADHRSDIYSLGIVFFQLMTGRLPFESNSALTLIYHHVHADPPAPRAIDPSISADYEAVILTCLKKAPSARYQTMRELITACERALARQRRSRALAIGTAVAGFATIVLALVAFWPLHLSTGTSTANPLVVGADVHPERIATVAMQAPAVPPGLGAARHDAYGWCADLIVHGITQHFRYCPGGSFIMGSAVTERDHRKDELTHQVTLSQGFWLADTACPQDLYRALTGANPSLERGDRLPVSYLSRDDCHRFCQTLNRAIPGLNARLPWEAEWEYACRSGANSATLSARQLTKAEACIDATAPRPVDESKPNPWGLRDMLGNVAQWCEDQYTAYGAQPVTDPRPHGVGDGVGRGGCWEDMLGDCNSARRIRFWTDFPARDTGFRLAIDAPHSAAGPGEGP